jgi:hypothetical protein
MTIRDHCQEATCIEVYLCAAGEARARFEVQAR